MKKSILSVVFLSLVLAVKAFPSRIPAVIPHPAPDTSMAVLPSWTELKELKIRTFQDVVIDANVVVILAEEAGNTLRMEGEPGFLNYVTVKELGGKLRISSPTKGPKVKGYIWVPVKKLKTLRLGNNAIVRSSTELDTPQLDIELNGTCNVRLVTNGIINLIENEDMEFNYQKNTIHNIMRTPLH